MQNSVGRNASKIIENTGVAKINRLGSDSVENCLFYQFVWFVVNMYRNSVGSK